MATTTKASSTDLPVPREALLELGLTEEDIESALQRRPETVAFQADQHPDAWFDVARVQRKLKALGLFRHTKGRWDGVRLRLNEGLDPWQIVWVLAPVFGWVHYDAEVDAVVRVIRTAWVEIPRKNGKLLRPSTPVPTPTGWTTMGDLRPGSTVFAPDGSPTTVEWVSQLQRQASYVVRFADGAQVVAGPDHEWLVNDRRIGCARSVTTLELARTLTFGSRDDRRYTVDVAGPVQTPTAELPVDPWVLGYWLGNGHRETGRIAIGGWKGVGDLEHVEAQLARAGVRWTLDRGNDLMRRYATVRGLAASLRDLGVLERKHIPDAYLFASIGQRRALLAGLLDSDGTCTSTARSPRVEYASSDEELARGVLALVRSLGWKATLHDRQTASGRTGFRLTFTAYADEPPFWSPRKAAALPSRPDRAPRSRTNAVVAVTSTGVVEPMVCIAVEHESHCYLAGEAFTPTHNSTLASGISGLLLLADSEAGAEVYNAAGSTLQATRVFEDAKRMLMTSGAARKRIEPLKDVVRVPRTGGILRVLSRVAETAHGLNVSGAVVDEVHTLRLRRALVEAIETGTGAREQPLVLFITTADDAEDGTIYDEKHQRVLNVASGVTPDTSFYGVIWAASDTDDPFADETLAKANPGAGKSPTWTYLHGEAEKARTTPSYLNTYLRLTLNLRRREQARWLDLDQWDALDGPVDRAALRGRRAWGGLDLSAVSDFTAWAVWVESTRPGVELDLLTRFWVPAERVEDLQRQLLVPLEQWIAQGLVVATEGDVIDYAAVKAAVVGDCRHLDVQRVSYDRMFAGQLVQELDTELDGIELAPVGQGFIGLSPACKELERLVGGRAMRHGGNPVLRWMASVVEVKNDGVDNIRPVKPDRKKASTRIDGIQAAVTGLDGYLRRVQDADERLYMFR